MPRQKKAKAIVQASPVDRFVGMVSQHPRETVALFMITIAISMIFGNALFLQKGPHPAPIFISRPLSGYNKYSTNLSSTLSQTGSVESEAAAGARLHVRQQLIADIQRELSGRGFYHGIADGIWGAKTDIAARDFLQAGGLKISPEPAEGLLRAIQSSNTKRKIEPVRENDPIATLISPSERIKAIQRVLTDFGYGQLKPTGVSDPETQAAIEKFERNRRLPITGKISDRLVRELAATTGRPLD